MVIYSLREKGSMLSFSSLHNDTKKVLKSVVSILKKNKLLTLSTADNQQPHACSAYYVFDDELNLYIWTGVHTRHATNIAENNRVAVTIANSSQAWGSSLQGLQMHGKASVVKGEFLKASGLYLKRFKKCLTLIKRPQDFHAKVFESRLYKIQIDKVKVFDEKTFGKEVWVELVIKR